MLVVRRLSMRRAESVILYEAIRRSEAGEGREAYV